MFRFVVLAAAILGAIALLTRSERARRGFWVLFGLAMLYTVLKITGIMEAVAPSRHGVY
jgi:hypothetical protein